MKNSKHHNSQQPFPDKPLSKAEFEQLLAKNEDLPLRKDMITLLTYIQNTKVIGTQSTGNMPLKSIREVTALFVAPPVLDRKIGNQVFRLRGEDEVWQLYFLHVLAKIGNLIRTPRGKAWRLKKDGKAFLKLNPFQQVAYLLNTWWYHINWLIAYPRTGMGEALPASFPEQTLAYLDALPINTSIKFNMFADELIKTSGMKWHSENQDQANRFLRVAVKAMVIEILKNFGVLETEYETSPSDLTGAKELISFSIHRFGKELLLSLAMMGREEF